MIKKITRFSHSFINFSYGGCICVYYNSPMSSRFVLFFRYKLIVIAINLRMRKDISFPAGGHCTVIKQTCQQQLGDYFRMTSNSFQFFSFRSRYSNNLLFFDTRNKLNLIDFGGNPINIEKSSKETIYNEHLSTIYHELTVSVTSNHSMRSLTVASPLYSPSDCRL